MSTNEDEIRRRLQEAADEGDHLEEQIKQLEAGSAASPEGAFSPEFEARTQGALTRARGMLGRLRGTDSTQVAPAPSQAPPPSDFDEIRAALEAEATGGGGAGTPTPGFDDIRRQLDQEAAKGTPGTPDGDPETSRDEGGSEIGDFFRNVFTEERGRLGLGEEAARGVARVPGQITEGTGGIIQAGAARRRANLDDPLTFAGAIGRSAGGERFRERTLASVDRQEAVGEAVEQTGRESREFFPRSADADPMDLMDPNTLVAGGAEAIGQIGGQILLAAMTGGGSAVTQFLMFAGPTVALEGGNAFLETKKDMMERGIEEEEAERRAAGVAVTTAAGAMALERIPAARFLFRRIPGAESVFGQRVAQALAGRGNLGTQILSGAAAEGMQEALQEAWSATVQDVQANNPDAWEDIGPRLAASMVFGGIGGAGGAGIQAAVERASGDDFPRPPLAPDGDQAPPAAPSSPAAPTREADVREQLDAEVEAAAPAEPAADPTEERRDSARTGFGRRIADLADPDRARRLEELEGVTREQAERIQQQEAELRERYTDKLTGLSNQDAWLEARKRFDLDEGTSVPGKEIVWIDLSNFKGVNDREGEAQGDAELRRAAEVLKGIPGVEIRDKARAGGDEFALIADEGKGEPIGRLIQELFGERTVADTEMRLHARFGVGATWQEAAKAAQEAKKRETGPRHRNVTDQGVVEAEPTPQERAAEESGLDAEAGRRAQARADERVKEQAAVQEGPPPIEEHAGKTRRAEIFEFEGGGYSVAIYDRETGKRHPAVRRFPDLDAAGEYAAEQVADRVAPKAADPVTPDPEAERAATAAELANAPLDGFGARVRRVKMTKGKVIPTREGVASTEPTVTYEETYEDGTEVVRNEAGEVLELHNPSDATLDVDAELQKSIDATENKKRQREGRATPVIERTLARRDMWPEATPAQAVEVEEAMRSVVPGQGITLDGLDADRFDELMRAAINYVRGDTVGIEALQRAEARRTELRPGGFARIAEESAHDEFFGLSEGDLVEVLTMDGENASVEILTETGLLDEVAVVPIEVLEAIDSSEVHAKERALFDERRKARAAASRDEIGGELEKVRDKPRAKQKVEVGGPGTDSAADLMAGLILLQDEDPVDLSFFETVGKIEKGEDTLTLIKNTDHEEQPDFGLFTVVATNQAGEHRQIAGIDGVQKDEVYLFTSAGEQLTVGDMEQRMKDGLDEIDRRALEDFRDAVELLPRATRKAMHRILPTSDEIEAVAVDVEPAAAAPVSTDRELDRFIVSGIRQLMGGPRADVRSMSDSDLMTEIDETLFPWISDPAEIPGGGTIAFESGELLHLRGRHNRQQLEVTLPNGASYVLADAPLRDLVRRAVAPTDVELEVAGQLRINLEGGGPQRANRTGLPRDVDPQTRREGKAAEAAAQREAELEARILLGDEIASPEAVAEIEAAEEADDARAGVEGAPQAEPATEPTAAVSRAGDVGRIDGAPRGGRPGGARDVQEDVRAPTEQPPREVDAGPDRADGDGGGDAGSGAGDGLGDAGSRAPGRVLGHNLTITGSVDIGGGGPITKTKRNLEAIRILKAIEAEGRIATKDEQEALALYAGWGGIPQVFNQEHKRFGEYARELKELLTPEEYRAAMDSTVNAHFTSRSVITAMHRAVQAMGLPANARVLEPAAGIGHFIGLSPPTYKWFGIELDSLTGRMAQLIYPRHEIHQRGFEATPLPNNHFDAAISNVPFGDFVVDDPGYRDLRFSIHNYFFAKSLDKVRPGGVVAFITSSFTMDAKDSTVRRYLSERADFLGAVRLPETAFRKSSGTDVVTDVIFLRKRAEGEPASDLDQPWLELQATETPDGPYSINAYYATNPRQVVGRTTLSGSMYGDRSLSMNVEEVDDGRSLGVKIEEALANLPKDVVTRREGPVATAIDLPPADQEGSQEGAMRVVDGEIMQVREGRLVPAKVPKTQTANVKALIGLRDEARRLLSLQLNDASQVEIDASMAELNKLYDRYVKKRGPINKENVTAAGVVLRPNWTPFRSDPDAALVAALERYDSENETATKAPIFSKRVIEARSEITEVQQPADALPVTLAQLGRVDLDMMAKMAGVTREEMIDELRGQIFQDPTTKEWETEDQYLSGNVRDKLILAKAAAAKDPSFGVNVAALEEVQPEDLPPSKIEASIGAPWVPVRVYEDFINELLEKGQHSRITLSHSASQAAWLVESGTAWGPLAVNKWGTERVNALRIFEGALNQRSPTVTYKDPNGKSVVDVEETAKAKGKYQDMKEHFAEWLWKRDDAEDLAREYNDRFNNTRTREFRAPRDPKTGEGFSPAGISPGITPRAHQLDAAWRIISSGNTMLAHVVGAGKTFTMQIASMEEKRMGLSKKPVHVVPNHMLEQYSREFLQLYPSARILAAEGKDFEKAKRQQLLARIATGDWDAVIMTHSAFGRMDVSRETRQRHAEAELADVEDQLREARAHSVGETKMVKLLVKARKKAQERLDRLMKADAKDEGITFEETGIDRIFLDEAHLFKNLNTVSKVQGRGIAGNQRAADMYMKIQYLEGLNPGRSAVFATATPIANTMVEVFVMMKYLQGPLLEQRGLSHFDAWAAQFGETVMRAEVKPDGSGYRMHERFAQFKNVPELSQMFREVWDVKRQADLDLKVPRVVSRSARVIVSPASAELQSLVAELAQRASNMRSVDPSVDNMLKITTEGRKGALDMRLMSPWLERDPDGKIEKAADEIYDIWAETADEKLTQLVWIDFSAPKPGQFSVYQDLKDVLMERGVPEKEIAFIHDANTDQRKAKLFQQVRDGSVRVLFGSTEKMGVGTNVQNKIVAMHHLDAPWRPADIEQRDGRGVRQGNNNDEIAIVRYVTEGSFDAYMWQGLERKQFYIEQVMTGDPSLRRIEDVGDTVLNAAETKALASGNPLAIEKASVDADVARLQRSARSHLDEQFRVRQNIAKLPPQIAALKERLEHARADAKRRIPTSGEKFAIRIGKAEYAERPKAAEKLVDAIADYMNEAAHDEVRKLGSMAGFSLEIAPPHFGLTTKKPRLRLRGELVHEVQVENITNGLGLIRTLEALAERVPKQAEHAEAGIKALEEDLRQSQKMAGEKFARQDELDRLIARKAEIDEALNITGRQQDEQISRSEDDESGTGEDTYGEAGLTRAELEERGDAGFLDVRPLFERRATRDRIITSTSEEVEARYQAAKGIKRDSLFERARKGWENFKNAMTRAHPELNPDESTTMAMNVDILRQHGSARDWSLAMAYSEVRKVMDGLDEAQVDLVTRMLVLPDIQKDLEEGLYDGREDDLPFGYDEATLVEDMAKFSAAATADSAVADALRRRGEINRALTKQLVHAELLPAGVLEDERYYHRQVMKYFQARDFVSVEIGGQDIRLRTKGFQKGRVGGGDFNTAYQESEIEWMSQGFELLARIQTLERIQQLNDVKGELKKMARALNHEAAMDAWRAELGLEEGEITDEEDPFKVYSTRIAFSNAGLAKLAAAGELSSAGGRYDELIHDLGTSYEDWKAEMAARDKELREPFRFEHSDWFGFLSHLLENDLPGAMQAGTVFKAIRQREKLTQELAGHRYIDPKSGESLLKIAPEGYQVWQPKRGQNLFLGLTVEERVSDAVLKGERTLEQEDVRQQLMVGGPKEEWIIPGNLAHALDNITPFADTDAVDNLWRAGQQSWKQWILLNPIRFLRYNLNNMSGDADIAFAYDPQIVKGAVQAAKDLAAYFRGRASPTLEKEILRLTKLGVIGSTLRVAEIPDISDAGAFQFLTRGKLNPGQKVVNKYWSSVRGFTDWRENILRLAAARYFEEKIETGTEPIYAASRKTEIDAITSPQAKAAKLARELIGDYGNISKGGIWLRRHMIPFYSWIEINAPRYYRLLMNTRHEGQVKGRGRRLSGVAIKKGGMAVLKMNILFMLANLWNHLFFPDEEEELQDNRRQLHLILGRREDGTIRSLRLEGALSDALEWFNLQDYPSDIADLLANRKDILDQGAEFVKAPVERILNSWEPFTKTIFETVMGRSTFPSVFEKGKSFDFRTRVIRDRAEHVARTFSLDRLYNRVTGKPRRPSSNPIDDLLGTVLLYSTDPGEAALWQTKDMVSDWLEESGQERADISPTKRSTALYYWKRAVQWGDDDAAERWEAKYRELGGTDQGMRQSLRLTAPLGGIAQSQHAAFFESLTPREQDIVELAEEWFYAVYQDVTPPTAGAVQRRTVRRRR